MKSVKISHIPINKLYKSYYQIYSLFVEIINLCYSIFKEYELGIYTTNLSKQDLIEIAKKVASDIKMYSYISKPTKSKIKNKYKISNSEFLKAISIIKKHRYMASILGSEIKFKYNLDNVNAITTYKDFIKKYGINIPNKPMIANDLPDTNAPFEILSTLLNDNQLKFISTFVNLSKFDIYNVENLNQIYNSFKNFVDIRSFALQLVYKDTFNYLVNGLKMAGQITYLKLIDN